MDDTQQSRTSDAAVKNKRRSSILKSQRPPRAPFSELEFNVATPTDSGKSRRVSFSRRTGIAEFATNEATTTWKNFYEEHNKSLESSGNESGSKQSVTHLGRRVFDQQFEEVEADLIATHNTGPNINITSSLNIFEHQLASLECTDDLTAPINKFELSAFTNNHTRLFDDPDIPSGEVTDVKVNFSTVKIDDLDEIQNDLNQNFGNACPRQNLSEYIEVDLNMTQVRNEDDMSITDTVHSPKVQALSKSRIDTDLDKENIAINPYAVPRETDNFAINDDSNKVLVFDGKRLTVQTEKIEDDYRHSIPGVPDMPQRKTIVLNVNDDLPNFIDEPHSCTSDFIAGDLKRSMMDMSIESTEVKSRTVMFDNDSGNISVTRAVTSEEKRRTILYEDNGNISITQAVPTNIVAEKHRTIYDCDISMTQAVPTNLEILHDKRKTIVFEDANISMTQALPVNILPDKTKRRTIVYEDNDGNLSITQAVPNTQITEAVPDKRRTIVYEDNTGNISVTQAIPSNIIIAENSDDRQRTVIFESDTGNISVTKVVPSNIILQDQVSLNSSRSQIPVESRRRTIVYENDTGNLSITQAVPSRVIQGIVQNFPNDAKVKDESKGRTIVIDDDADMSMTQAVPVYINVPQQNENDVKENSKNTINKRRTVVFDNEDADISMTQAVPMNVIENINPFAASSFPKKRRTVVFENEGADISITQTVNTNQMSIVQNVHDDLEDALNDALHRNIGRSHRTIIFDNDTKNTEDRNISILKKSQHVQEENVAPSQNMVGNSGNRRTKIFDDNSATRALLANILDDMAESAQSKDEEVQNMDIERVQSNRSNISQLLDMSMADTIIEDIPLIPKSLKPQEKHASSIAKPIPFDLLLITNENESKSLNKSRYAIDTDSVNVEEVVVYQAALSKPPEQGDSGVQDPIVNEEKMSTSSKIGEEKQNNEMLSKTVDVEEIQSHTSKKTQEEETDLNKKNINETDLDKENMNEMDLEKDESEQVQPDVQDDQSEASSRMSKSILHDLLDMNGEDDKGLMTQAVASSEPISSITSPNSSDKLFFITTEDEDAKIQTDSPKVASHSPLQLEYKEGPSIVESIEKKLEYIKETIKEDSTTKHRHSEKGKTDLNKSKDKSHYKADDTNELLSLLSALTDKTIDKKFDDLGEDKEQVEPILKERLALENKSEEPQSRLGCALRRQSTVLSREDLLNNISMAGAALKSFRDIDSSLENTSQISPDLKSRRKSVRLSNEVVKTLQFDESVSEIMSSGKKTPLKKTAFGETAYMQESKSKVIPDFLKHVSDGIKELMDDLVKPNADNILPFDAGGLDRGVRGTASTCSAQIQANLVTSSQVDIVSGLYSNRESFYDGQIDKISSSDIINDAVNRSVSRALKSPIKSKTTAHSSDSSVTKLRYSDNTSNSKYRTANKSPESSDAASTGYAKPTQPIPGRVLVFDPHNPLNNICLESEMFSDAHRYNPAISTDTVCESQHSNSMQISITETEKDMEVERVSTQYNVGSIRRSVQQSGDSGKIAESQSIMSNISKPMSIDHSTDTELKDVKDVEINTLIAMKGNKELLDASSSLTLVDDAIARSTYSESKNATSQESISKSPVRVIYSVDPDSLPAKLDSDFTSTDEIDKLPKKRHRSPTRRDKHRNCSLASLDVTPKPILKMQKLSENPDESKAIDSSQSDKSNAEEKRKKSRKSKSKKPGTDVTVQQLMTEYNMGPIDTDALDEQNELNIDPKSETSTVEPTQSSSQTDVECRSVEVVSSCTSSKNLRRVKSGMTSASGQSRVSRMDWQTEPDSECEASTNVVAKIDMLPFMGSHECEWESSSGDTWSFRLLHGRLHLSVRLEHRHGNATRTLVRADTPVRSVSLELVPFERTNLLASQSVTFAAETMRYFISRGCATAGAVPPLVRRCAAAARLAARWGRCMHEARLHLAYSLSPDAVLTLKVANIPLRCVWEVTMRLELVVDDARSAPWVRASDVRVRRVIPAGEGVRLPRALQRLPKDWGHAPRTIWRVFKYLKNKTHEDDDVFIDL